MQRNILFILFSSFLIASIFLSSCAGTKKNDDNQVSDDKAQQQDLDDIEALLGISSDTPEQTPPPKQKNRGEKLDLLENEVGGQSDNSMASAALAQEQTTTDETKKFEKEVVDLKNQLKQKDRRIASLENEVALKNNELEDMPVPDHNYLCMLQSKYLRRERNKRKNLGGWTYLPIHCF